MKTKPQKFNHIWIDWLKLNVYWSVSSLEDFEQTFKREFGILPDIQESNGGKFFSVLKEDQRIGVIWIRKPFKFQILAHECFHCVHWIMQERGMRLDDSSEEVYAYLLQYLICKINEYK